MIRDQLKKTLMMSLKNQLRKYNKELTIKTRAALIMWSEWLIVCFALFTDGIVVAGNSCMPRIMLLNENEIALTVRNATAYALLTEKFIAHFIDSFNHSPGEVTGKPEKQIQEKRRVLGWRAAM